MHNKMPTAVVLGAGVAGLTAAANLGQRGMRVSLVEREAILGGNARTVCCKAVEGDCQTCGGCLLADAQAALRETHGVELLLETSVTRVERVNGGFSVQVETQGQPHTIEADAVVLATGFDHIDAHTKGPYGYGILPSVMTGHEMERRLTDEGQAAFDDMALERLAFVQCVGSRDEHVGRGYCSQVCCRYAVRLARLLRSRMPDLDVTFFKMDIQNGGRDFCPLAAQAKEEGIRFVAGLPAVIRRSTEHPGRAAFLYDDIVSGEIRQEDFDLVVLAVGMQPRADADTVADRFGLNLNADGFFETRTAAGNDTVVPGVFVAGACQAPRSIAESVAHAREAAAACYRYLQEKA